MDLSDEEHVRRRLRAGMAADARDIDVLQALNEGEPICGEEEALPRDAVPASLCLMGAPLAQRKVGRATPR
jgi:hypothetical protein